MYPCLRCGTVLVGNPRRHDIKDLTSTDLCQFVPQGLQRTTGVLFEPKAAEKVLSDNQREADKHGICGAKDAPVILTGDFNVDQTNEIYSIFTKSGLLKYSYEAARVRFAENGTFNAFKTEYFTQSRIDHVFVSPATQVEAYGILTNSYWTENNASGKSLKSADAPQEISFDTYTRKNPSDHYPVFVRVVF